MTPEAVSLLERLKAAPIPSADFTDCMAAPMRELCAANLADLFEPPPYLWKLTFTGRNYVGDFDV